MKTILYSLIAIMLFGSIAPAIKGRKEEPKHIYLEATGNNLSSGVIDKSATILSKRLHLYFKSPDALARAVPGKQLIEVIYPASADQGIVDDLVTHKGAIAFYEVYDHSEMSDLLDGNNTIFAMMTTDSTDNKSGRLGCVQNGEKSRINAYLKTLDIGNKCRFAWTESQEGMKVCLLPLRNDSNNPVIKGSDIESSSFKENRIFFKLNDNASERWQETTRRDIGRSIAILLDDSVLSYPVIRSVIVGGDTEVSGRFSESFGKYVSAMISSGELPVEFIIVK
jgi:preprotein translocase subunit SecD